MTKEISCDLLQRLLESTCCLSSVGLFRTYTRFSHARKCSQIAETIRYQSLRLLNNTEGFNLVSRFRDLEAKSESEPSFVTGASFVRMFRAFLFAPRNQTAFDILLCVRRVRPLLSENRDARDLHGRRSPYLLRIFLEYLKYLI